MSNAYLLDTHVLIWAQTSPEKLRPKTRTLLSDPAHRLYVSIASIWEMAIKVNLERLTPMPPNYISLLREQGFSILHVSAEDVLAVQSLPLLHRDPFDRMMVVQAKSRNIPLVTNDRQIEQYDVTLMKA